MKFRFLLFFVTKKVKVQFLKSFVFFIKNENVLFCKLIIKFLILFMYGELESELQASASWEKPLRVGEFASSSPTRNHPYSLVFRPLWTRRDLRYTGVTGSVTA